MAVTYDKGDLVRIAAIFKNAAGTPIDPTTVQFKFTTPALVTTTYTYPSDAQLVKDSTGNYHVDIDANTNGTWRVRFQSSGTGQAAAEDEFFIKSDF